MARRLYAVGRYDRQWERGVEGIHGIANFANSLGINLCIEVWNRLENRVLNTAAEGVAFVKVRAGNTMPLRLRGNLATIARRAFDNFELWVRRYNAADPQYR